MQVEVIQFLWDWHNHYGINTPVPMTLFKQLTFCNIDSAKGLYRKQGDHINNYSIYKKHSSVFTIYVDKAKNLPDIRESKIACRDYCNAYGLDNNIKIRTLLWMSPTYFEFVKKKYSGIIFNSPVNKLKKKIYTSWIENPDGTYTLNCVFRAHLLQRVGILNEWKNVRKPYKVDKFYCREFFTPGGWDLKWWY